MKEVTQGKSNSIRVFSEEFKKSKVNELIEKRVTMAQLCKLYHVSRTSVYKWLYKYSPLQEKRVKLVVEMESESNKTMRLQQQVAELERIVGQKQIEIDYLNKLLEIGSDEMGFDIKKNFNARLSNGSGSTKKTSE